MLQLKKRALLAASRMLAAMSSGENHSLDRTALIPADGPILIWTMDRLGDVVRSTVMLRAVALRYPHSRLVVIAAKRAAGALENNPRIDELIVVRDHNNLLEHLRIAWRLRARSWSCGMVADVDVNWAMLGQLIFTVARVRLYAVFDLGQPIPLHARVVSMGECQSWLTAFRRLAVVLGADEDNQPPEVFPSAAERNQLSSRLETLGLDVKQPFFLLHPGGGGQTVNRQWPAQAFGALVTQLPEQWSFPVVVSGLAHEREVVDEVVGALGGPVHDLCGQLSLRELIALISFQSICIMNDTGPLHLALALRRPTVAILGPTNRETVGVPAEASVATLTLPCQPCAFLTDWQPCSNPSEGQCLKALRPEQVLEALAPQVQRLLADHDARPVQ